MSTEALKSFALRTVAAAALAAPMLLPARVFAAERKITLDEAYHMAISTNESVRIAGEGVSQAESGLDKTFARILPNLTAEGAYTRYSEQKKSGLFVLQPDEATRLDVKLTQPLYTGGREWSARRQSKLGIESSKEGLGLSKENIIRATARAYFGLLKAQKDLEIKDAALKRAVERQKVAEARFQVGEVTRSAVLRAEAETAGAEAELTKSKTNLIDAGNLLKRVVGSGDDLVVEEPPSRKEAGLDIDALVKTALENRRDYKQSVLNERIAGEGITFARSGFFPQLRAEGIYSYRGQDPKTTFFVQDSLSAAIVLTYPIFEGGLRKAELSEARSKFREAELKRLGLKRDIEVDIKEALNNVEAVRALNESYKKQLAFAEENYKMVFEQFKFGVATTVDVIDADATLISAQRSYVNAAYDLQLSILDLKYRAGLLSSEAPDAFNKY